MRLYLQPVIEKGYTDNVLFLPQAKFSLIG